MQLRFFPDPILKKTSQPVQNFNDQLRLLASQMLSTMYANNGIGLAAPQIGKSIRLFVMDVFAGSADFTEDQDDVTAGQDLAETANTNPQKKAIELDQIVSEGAAQEKLAEQTKTNHSQQPPPADEPVEDGQIQALVTPPLKPNKPIVVVNPVIVSRSNELEISNESCLSLPGVNVDAQRAPWIEVRYQNLNGEFENKHLDGLAAICFQHELDHLDGKLIWDFLSPVHRNILKKKYLKNHQESLKN